jgi:hypothetical protein
MVRPRIGSQVFFHHTMRQHNTEYSVAERFLNCGCRMNTACLSFAPPVSSEYCRINFPSLAASWSASEDFSGFSEEVEPKFIFNISQ